MGLPHFLLHVIPCISFRQVPLWANILKLGEWSYSSVGVLTFYWIFWFLQVPSLPFCAFPIDHVQKVLWVCLILRYLEHSTSSFPSLSLAAVHFYSFSWPSLLLSYFPPYIIWPIFPLLFSSHTPVPSICLTWVFFPLLSKIEAFLLGLSFLLIVIWSVSCVMVIVNVFASTHFSVSIYHACHFGSLLNHWRWYFLVPYICIQSLWYSHF